MMGVDLMVLGKDEPTFGEGVLVSYDEGVLVVRLQNELTVGVGIKIHAKIRNEEFWLRGRVANRMDDVLVIQIDKKYKRDVRDFSRQHGAISLVFSVADNEKEIEAWAKGEGRVDESWHRPDEYMNFSASGLNFNSPLALEQGQSLKLGLRIPTADSGKTWNVIGEVIRCAPSPDGFSVSVKFLGLPDDCCKELVDFTLRLLD